MTQPTLLDHLRALAEERDAKAVIDARVKELRAAFDEANKELFYAQRLGAEMIVRHETAVRKAGAEIYLNTGEKKPAPGVEVKIYKSLSIIDPAAALAWATEKQMALIPARVDEKALLAIAAAMTPPLPFVLQSEEPKVTIATQLKLEQLAEVVS